MKKLILAGCVLTCALSVFAQGTIVFNNHVVNSVVAWVYGPDPANPGLAQQGNDASGFPAGSVVYGGPRLSGAGFTAQLWGAPGANAALSSLVACTGYSSAGFRTGNAAGLWTTSTDAAVVPGAAEGSVATLQVRVWDNTGGATTWDQAVAANAIRGESALFNSPALGGLSPAPNLIGLTSFNLAGGGITPEPTTFALMGLGAAALLIFRRK